MSVARSLGLCGNLFSTCRSGQRGLSATDGRQQLTPVCGISTSDRQSVYPPCHAGKLEASYLGARLESDFSDGGVADWLAVRRFSLKSATNDAELSRLALTQIGREGRYR